MISRWPLREVVEVGVMLLTEREWRQRAVLCTEYGGINNRLSVIIPFCSQLDSCRDDNVQGRTVKGRCDGIFCTWYVGKPQLSQL